MRKHENLSTTPTYSSNFVNGLAATEGVLAAKRIVEYHRLRAYVFVLFKMGEKKGESKSGAITRAERILKAGSIQGRTIGSKVDCGVIN